MRWDTNTPIPNTQNITPAPHVNLNNWNTTSHNLQFALFNTNISSATFINSDLRNAKFAVGANVSSANFTNANILGAHFDGLTSNGFTHAQLASTASYQNQNLSSVRFVSDELNSWDISNQNLTNANFSAADLTNANLTNATITGTTFNSAQGLSFSQFRSTANFTQRNLAGSRLNRLNLSSWNFSHQNLTNSTLLLANLTNAYFIQANITGVNFNGSTLNRDQLQATANYQNKTLNSLTLSNLDLTNIKVNAQNLSNDNFTNTLLVNGNFLRANLSGANFTNADLAPSTLTNANMTKANFSDADLRGAVGFLPVASTITANTIRPNGVIRDLSLTSGERLTIRNNITPVTALNSAIFNDNSTLEFLLGANWTSPFRFAPGVTPALAGTLDLEFPNSVDTSAFVGESFQIFQWPFSLTGSNAFSAITHDPRVTFDTSALYTTGVVTVLSSGILPPAPEPATLLLSASLFPLLLGRKSRKRTV